MKILLAPSQFAPHRGGVEEATLKLATHLLQGGDDVVVVTNRHPSSLCRREVIEGVRVVRIELVSPGRRPSSWFSYFISRYRLRSELAEVGREAEVAHVMCASVQLAPIAAWARSAGVPLVITSHGETAMDAGRLYQRSVRMRRMLRRQARAAAALTSCSAWTARAASEVAPDFLRSTVVANGIDLEDWAHVPPPPDAPVAAVWGRHEPQKGIDRLIAAWPLVRARLPGAQLVVGGSGSETPALIAAAGDGVRFLGPLDRAGVADLLARSRIAVVPSRIEPFGIAALEALAAGRGLVYAAGTGLVEAAGPCGRAVDCADPAALAGAVVDELRCPSPAAEGRAWAARNTWDVVTQRYRAIYLQATG